MIMVPFLLAVNWILIPYNIFSEGHGFMGKITHFINNYVFLPKDASRLGGGLAISSARVAIIQRLVSMMKKQATTRPNFIL